MVWRVNFFQTTRGNLPVKEFIEEQDRSTQTKIARSIRLLVDYGPFLKPPDIKKLQGKLYELRIPGKVAVRIFYTTVKGEFLLTACIQKENPENSLEGIKNSI